MVIDLVLIGLAVTLFPLPLMAFVLVLASSRGARKGVVFILAWLACLVAVTAAVLLLTGGQPPPPHSPPSVAALAFFCLLATSTLLAMELYVVFSPEKARRTLPGLRERLLRRKEPAVVSLCLLLGMRLVGRSLYRLVG